MRKLRLVVRSRRGALPMVVAVGVVSASACGSKSGLPFADTPSIDASASGGSGGLGGTAGAGGGIVIDAGSTGGTGGAGGSELCELGDLQDYDVELPAEGVPATPGQICAATVEPVESGRAARVVLSASPGDLQSAQGFIEIDPALEQRVVGLPVIEVIDATAPALFGLAVSNVSKASGGFSFDASFADPVPTPETTFDLSLTRMTLRISVEISCEPSTETRTLHAATDVHLCIGDQELEWVSSGERCVVCRVIAEMAPSPIVPDKRLDGLPLAHALRLRIIELARVSNTVVLLAENDGGEGLEYEWHPSAGTVERLAPDVIAWTLEDGTPAPMIQAAVYGDTAAAVASFAWNEAA